MKTLKNYILEVLAQKSDYSKHDFKYPLVAIEILLNGDKLRLGPQGHDGSFSKDDLSEDDIENLKVLRDNITTSTKDDFDNAIKSSGYKWNKIFKGDLSGYSDGLESGNKGNAFEKYFIDNYKEKFENEVKKYFNYDGLKSINAVGGQNNRRPLKFTDASISCGDVPTNYNIGRVISDVTIDTDKGECYLSLKSGDKVTFANAGIMKIFPKGWFKGEENLPIDGKNLLKMLCIDEEKFKDVFNSYKGEDGRKSKVSDKETVDVTDKLKSNDMFRHFIKSVMGCGYILVHQVKGDDIEYIDLTDESKLNDFIKDMKSAVVKYPKNGSAKRVDIEIEYNGIKFLLNLRNKQSGVYPSHFMADYKFI